MKILFVANTAWSIYNFRFGLIEFLIKKKFVVAVLAPKDDFFEKLQEMGCLVYELPISAKGVNPFVDFLLTLKLLMSYRAIKPDFIIHYTIKPNIYGSIAARIAKIPSIAVTTGLGYTFIKNNLISKIAKLLYKFAFKSPEEVWFLNVDDREIFIRHGLIDEKRAVLLHSEGVNTHYFAPTLINKMDDKFRFLLISRMLWDKGIAEYVEAAQIIKNKYPLVIFQLLGATGVENPSVIALEQIKKWESLGYVEYLGTTNDVRPLISGADCIVLPSFYREGVPRTLLEAAAMGKPLITTDNVGCRDVVIHGETGFICPVKNSKLLADCMEKLIKMSEEERIFMGAAGRHFITMKFDENLIVSQYMDTLAKFGITS